MNMLWNDLHDLFDADDGSLPEIWITNLSADGISTIYTLIWTVATTLPGEPAFWDKRREQASLLGSVPNAARLVAENVAEPFHFIAHGISFGAGHYRISAYLSSKISSHSTTVWIPNGMQPCCTHSLGCSSRSNRPSRPRTLRSKMSSFPLRRVR